MKPNKINNLSNRIAYLLEKKGISQAELAKRIGVKKQTIQHLCASNKDRSKFTYEIAHALGVNLTWLAYGTGSDSNENQQIPILSQTEIIDNFTQKKPLFTTKFSENETLLSTLPHSIATYVPDDAIFSSDGNNAIIIISAIEELRQNQIILFFHAELATLSLRKLIYFDGKLALISNNPTIYPMVKLDRTYVPVGLVNEYRLIIDKN